MATRRVRNQQKGTGVKVNKVKYILFLGAVMLAAAALTACSVNFTTSHISSMKLSKDKEGTKEASTFGPQETIFANATVSNVSGKVTLNWKLIAVKVEGQPENTAVTNLDRSFELPSDGESSYNLSAPAAGWPAGNYKIELHMLVEGGEEKDLKVAPFTITGG
jgi:hypothetical protein